MFVIIFILLALFFTTTYFAGLQNDNIDEHVEHGFGPQLNLSSYNINYLIIISIIGLIITMICAVFLERNVSKIASKSGKSVGTALMGIASSLPLLIIVVTLALENRTDLIIINIIGANIVNLTLVLGSLSFVKPLKRGKSFGRGFFALIILLLSITNIFVIINSNLNISINNIAVINNYDGYFLIFLFLFFIFILNFFKSQEESHLKSKNLKLEIIFAIIFGLAVSWFANTTVKSFIIIAEMYNIPTILIGSVIAVIGASLPELAIGFVCLLKKEDEAIFSNLITSSIVNFNLGFGIAVIITGQIIFNNISLLIKIPFMVAVMIINVLFFLPGKDEKKKEIGLTRFEGVLLIALFLVWVFILIKLV
jgi:cation:H+ antiporter